MKRLVCLIALMAFSSPASARDPSFSFHGHRIHISALRHCRSLSCVRLAIPGVDWHRGRGRDADVDTTPDPVSTPAPAQPAPAPAQPPPLPSVIAQVAPMPTRAPTQAPQPATVAAPAPTPSVGFDLEKPQPAVPLKAQPATAEKLNAAPLDKAPEKPLVQQPPAAAQVAPKAPPQVARGNERGDEPADTPLGDWRTEGKNGLVHIEACGTALCGYVLNASTREKGEIILVNMKPKSAIWSGNIYSRSSGNSYYGTITMKEPNTLRVEACALGRFFCSGNNWTRLEQGGPERQHATSRAPSDRS